MLSQTDEILNFLKQGKSITSIEALNRWNCFRLAARINDLRNQGFNIVTVIIDDAVNCKRFAKYFLSKEK